MQLTAEVKPSDAFERYPASDLLVIPVGNKFRDVRKRIEVLFPDGR